VAQPRAAQPAQEAVRASAGVSTRPRISNPFLGLGAIVGLVTAFRAARLSPAQALWSV
jgi:hypothetical protein